MRIILENMGDVHDFLALVAAPSVTLTAGDVSKTLPLSQYIAETNSPEGAFTPEYAPISPDEAKTPAQCLDTYLEENAPEPAAPAAAGIAGVGAGPLATLAAGEAAPKRKRRTKAEMQADAERETGLQQPGTLPEGVGTEPGASTPETGGNAAVQAALAGNVVAATEALNATPIGDNPFANMSPEGETLVGKVADPVEPQRAVVPAVAKPETPEDIRVWIETTAIGKFNAITPVDHLNVAKAFIAAKGMPSYNESFGLVGLGNNIMGYTTEQRALHAAALDFLDWE